MVFSWIIGSLLKAIISMSQPGKRQASPQWFELCRRAVPKERRRQLDPTNSDVPTSERCWETSSNATYRKRQTPFSTQSVVLVRTFGVPSTRSIREFHATVKVTVIDAPCAASGKKCNTQNSKIGTWRFIGNLTNVAEPSNRQASTVRKSRCQEKSKPTPRQTVGPFEKIPPLA